MEIQRVLSHVQVIIPSGSLWCHVIYKR